MKRPSSTNRHRKQRFGWIQTQLQQIIDAKGHASVLDVGGRARYWNMLDPEFFPRVDVTLLNIEDTGLFTTGGPEGLRVEARTGDGCAMPEFADGQFDLCHSNSVIEHVGSLQAMIAFAKESRRVGQLYYHQAPDVAFPIEPHYGVPFFHWLPDPLRVRLVTKVKLGYGKKQEDSASAMAAVDHTLLPSAWLMRQLFPDAELKHERFMLLPKSIVVMGGRVEAPTEDADRDCSHRSDVGSEPEAARLQA